MSSKIINKLEEDDQIKHDIIIWILKNKCHKEYRTCSSGISDDCIDAGEKSLFSGQECRECRNQKQLMRYKLKTVAQKECDSKKNAARYKLKTQGVTGTNKK